MELSNVHLAFERLTFDPLGGTCVGLRSPDSVRVRVAALSTIFFHLIPAHVRQFVCKQRLLPPSACSTLATIASKCSGVVLGRGATANKFKEQLGAVPGMKDPVYNAPSLIRKQEA